MSLSKEPENYYQEKKSMLHTPFYDPERTYEENFNEGPFGDFANGQKVENKGEPQYEVLGQSVYLPFGIAAGPLVNGKFVKGALDKAFDIAVYKTVRTRQYPCNPWPNVLGVQIEGDLTLDLAEKGVVGKHVYKEPLSVTNSFGVPSFAPDFWQKDMAETVAYAKKGQVVIGSFQGTSTGDGNVEAYVADFVQAAKMVKETGAKILEVNLSCPNEGTAHLLCFDLQRTKTVVEAIKNEIGNTPLIIKIAYFAEQEQLKNLVQTVGQSVQGIAAINTIAAKIFDEQGNQALPGGPARAKSGVCGKPIQWAGVDMTKRLHLLRDDLGLSYTIFGGGGVTEPNDYTRYIDAGADAVMSATGAMWNPYLAQEIKKEILK